VAISKYNQIFCIAETKQKVVHSEDIELYHHKDNSVSLAWTVNEGISRRPSENEECFLVRQVSGQELEHKFQTFSISYEIYRNIRKRSQLQEPLFHK
jgi:glutamate-1-semialdehyde aminotransferase